MDVRLIAKANAKAARQGFKERYGHEGMSAAMKFVVNSGYDYEAAGGLTRTFMRATKSPGVGETR